MNSGWILRIFKIHYAIKQSPIVYGKFGIGHNPKFDNTIPISITLKIPNWYLYYQEKFNENDFPNAKNIKHNIFFCKFWFTKKKKRLFKTLKV